MKKNKLKSFTLLLMLSAGMSFNSIAQPVLTQSGLQTGISFNAYSLSGVSTASVMALSGANVTWDLSTATLGAPVATIDYMTAAATGYSATYPTANYALKLTFGTTIKYDLSVVTSTVMEDTAINVGTGGLQTFDDNRTTLVFPFTYGLTLTDAYKKTGQSATTVTHNYDAYGTLIVGTDTLHNLVRDMSTDNGVSTTSAIWYNVSPLYPVLQLNNSGATYLKPATTTGINSLSENNNKLNIYPNPLTEKLTINIDNNELTEITLYDLSSRKLLQQTFTNSTTINTEQLAKGIYLYEVRNRNGIIKNGKVIKQ